MHKFAREVGALVDDPTRYSAALYCALCPLSGTCGGLHCKASPFGCDEFCCGGKLDCTLVCRRHPDFLARLAEVDGFDLETLPQISGPQIDMRPGVVPLVYHGSNRRSPLAADAVAMRLADVIDFKQGSARFDTRGALADYFKVSPYTKLILTGVDHDAEIEKVWHLAERRLSIFKSLARLGIATATTPNFSTILDVPRTDNLHSMKRIAILYIEMCTAGIPTALHINGRTDRDFQRWAIFIKNRLGLNAISYEFITGSGLKTRIGQHVTWLNAVAEHVDRPLLIFVRGNPGCLPDLNKRYTPVYIESTSFVKTIKRQLSFRFGNSGLRWMTSKLPIATDLSDRMQTNHDEVVGSLVNRYPGLSAN